MPAVGPAVTLHDIDAKNSIIDIHTMFLLSTGHWCFTQQVFVQDTPKAPDFQARPFQETLGWLWYTADPRCCQLQRLSVYKCEAYAVASGIVYTAALFLFGKGGGLYVFAVTLFRNCLI